jgi:hypothetical protein
MVTSEAELRGAIAIVWVGSALPVGVRLTFPNVRFRVVDVAALLLWHQKHLVPF